MTNPQPVIPPAPPAPPSPPAPADAVDKGYPENTAVSDMKPEQQAAYWKDKARKWEGEARKGPAPSEIKALQDKAAAHDALEEANKSELQKANDKIAQLAEDNAKFQLNEMRRNALSAAKLPAEDIEFITATDPEKAKEQAERLAAKVKPVGPAGFQQGFQGDRGAKTSDVASGRELYRDKHKKKTT